MHVDFPRLPTQEEVRPTLVQMGMTDLVFRQRTTRFGPALTVRGALPVTTRTGPRTAYEQNLWATSEASGSFSLTVTTLDDGALDALFESVLGSLQPLP